MESMPGNIICKLSDRTYYLPSMTALSYRKFLQTASQILFDSDRVGRRHAVLVINFERLSELDGVLGYAMVDEIMRRIAGQLGDALNTADLVSIVGRYQICCLLSDLLTDSHALLAAHKVLRVLTAPFLLDERRLILSPRIGVALSSQNNGELSQLMSNASSALRQAKLERESIKLFVEEEENLLLLGIDLWSDLGRAIESSELYMSYQPQFNIASGEIKSTEALLRWNHPQRGPIRPDRLIQVAEGTDLMPKLTLWVFNTALRQCAEYRRAGLSAGVSINFSADDLRDPELVELVMQGLELWGVSPGDVVIELTETAVMEDHPGSLDVLYALKDMGLKLAMDDFGTGYSSMARLLELPLDEIKVDMVFVKNMITQPAHERIVDSMISLGHTLNLQVVAEGVEDLATYERLRMLGCDTIQGYFIGRGIPLPELIENIKNQAYNFPV
ncbi:putative bifunctional diguanylate cyclase/phosphodiesterase [Nitrosomonas cryotolerans]|nr:GGDEF domain-containing phosphodiesterase [Nitrosomonas cryotolerans]